jgi:hypothetical protein
MWRHSWSEWLFPVIVVLAIPLTLFLLLLFELISIPYVDFWIRELRTWLSSDDAKQKLGVVGMLGSIVPFLLAVFRAWRVGERHLPQRLAEYLEKCKQDLLLDRRFMLAVATGTKVPDAEGSWWQRRQTRMARERLKDYYERLAQLETNTEGELIELSKRLSVATGNKREIEVEKATAHLARGATFAREATVHSSGNSEEFRKKALFELKEAAVLDPSDFEIHRYYAAELEKDNSIFELRDALELWIAAAAAAKAPRIEASVRDRLGATLLGISYDPSLNAQQRKERLRNALMELDKSIELFRATPPEGVGGSKDPELAIALEHLGDVRVRLGTLPSAQQRYQDATAIFAALSDSASVRRLQDKLSEIGAEVLPIEEEPTPALAVVIAYMNLADAQIKVGEITDAQGKLSTARSALQKLTTEDGLDEKQREMVLHRIEALLREASKG